MIALSVLYPLVFAAFASEQLAAIDEARDGCSIALRVITLEGGILPYYVESFRGPGDKDLSSQFAGLNGTLPCAKYSYVLQRHGSKLSATKARGELTLSLKEDAQTVRAPDVNYFEGEASATSRAPKPGGVVVGRLHPFKADGQDFWVRLISVASTKVHEAKVDSAGEFRFYNFVYGFYTLSVMADSKVYLLKPILVKNVNQNSPLLVEIGADPLPIVLIN